MIISRPSLPSGFAYPDYIYHSTPDNRPTVLANAGKWKKIKLKIAASARLLMKTAHFALICRQLKTDNKVIKKNILQKTDKGEAGGKKIMPTFR